MYNKIVLVGNITRDIEMRFTQSGLEISNTAIATSRKYKSNTGEQKEEVCFVDITFFGRSAEIANQYLRKGSKILVEGRLMFDQWIDQNGQKRSKHSVNVDLMQMLDTKATSEGSNIQSNQNNNQSPSVYGNNRNHVQQQHTPPVIQKPDNTPEIDLDDEDIPF